jgi:hypothetical protein
MNKFQPNSPRFHYIDKGFYDLSNLKLVGSKRSVILSKSDSRRPELDITPFQFVLTKD